jgi:short-subunit dehydrogenase
MARRFAEGGYRVAMLARTEERLRRLEKEIPGSRGYVCDIADLNALRTSVEQARADLGPITVAIHNAAQGAFKTILEAAPETFEQLFRVNSTALMVLTQCVAPGMVDRGQGAIMVTGNTAAWRGKPNFCMFAPTKAAQRILAESIARDLGPKGIHVAYITIDAAIDTPLTRERMFPNKPDEFFTKPSAIADTVYHLAHQDRSAWSFNVEVRPYHEQW